MYARAFSEGLASLRRRGAQRLQQRRGSLRWIAAALIVFGLTFGYYAHLQGRFHRLKTDLHTSRAKPQDTTLLVGGQEPVLLERSPLNDGSLPEFLSATLLPGRGMSVLQLTASIPGHGVVLLLDSGTLDQAAKLIPDNNADRSGLVTQQLSAPFQLPWAGTLVGSPSGVGKPSVIEWRGHAIDLPLAGMGDLSRGGLLSSIASDSLDRNVMPDGGSVQGEFDAHDFGVGWPAQTHVSVAALLSSRAFDLRVVARNVGKEPEPVGIGWIPRLLLPSGSRSAATLYLPANQVEEQHGGHATGRLSEVAGTSLDYTSRLGRRLGAASLDATLVHLKTGFLDNGPVLELRDTESGVGLRMTALSPQIHALHVQTGDQPGVIRLGFQTNYDDPFSHAWKSDEEGSMYVLEPGRTVQWRVRFELFALSANNAAPL